MKKTDLLRQTMFLHFFDELLNFKIAKTFLNFQHVNVRIRPKKVRIRNTVFDS